MFIKLTFKSINFMFKVAQKRNLQVPCVMNFLRNINFNLDNLLAKINFSGGKTIIYISGKTVNPTNKHYNNLIITFKIKKKESL